MSTLPFQEDTQTAITPAPTFATAPAIVRAVTQGERLAHGYLVNATFATETARIDPLPHQRIAVYERMLPQPRLRFLLADDAGAGKTIMTGLYIAEMLARRLIRRVLIAPPAGLADNWESELRTLFGLHFEPVTGADAKGDNPFCGPQSDLVIVKIDTLAGANLFARLQEPAVQPYDLVVFDEAHKYIESPDLIDGLIEVVREMRHKGTSILVASQDPPSVPVALIELSSQIILHKFNSPAWLKHLQKANAALANLTPERMAQLKAGEAYVWSSKATDEAFSKGAVKVRCRPRVTQHGGATKVALDA